jgi:glycosyltransferase involved in cell wall biosynthesis
MSLEQFNPLVTVYIPTYNRVELLKRAVESVRQQTYQNLEIIIVDDCSKDGTHEYLEEINKKDSRVRYFIKDQNSGACVSRNIAIEKAKGEYITGLDDDDYFYKNRIKLFIDNVYELENYSFLCSRYTYLTQKGKIVSLIERTKPKKIDAKDLLTFNYVGNQIFCKTKLLKEHNFNNEIQAWQDIFTWYSILINNLPCKILNNYSYIVDIAHDGDRISLKKFEKISQAFYRFCQNFNLSGNELSILSTQLLNYNNKKYSIILLFFSWMNSKNMCSFLVFLYRVLKK